MIVQKSVNRFCQDIGQEIEIQEVYRVEQTSGCPVDWTIISWRCKNYPGCEFYKAKKCKLEEEYLTSN